MWSRHNRMLVVALVALLLGLSLSGAVHADQVSNGCTIVDNPTATHHTVCQGADLSFNVLTNINLAYANLANANFSSTNLGGASLRSANLSSANFSNANLAGADLSSANLSGSNMSQASLAGANVTGANLASVIWFNTICPNGVPSVAYGGTCPSDTQPSGGELPPAVVPELSPVVLFGSGLLLLGGVALRAGRRRSRGR